MSDKCLLISLGLDCASAIQEPDPFLTVIQPVAGREWGLSLQSDAVTGDGDVSGFGKAQRVLPHTLPSTHLLAHQPCSSFICFFDL